MTEDNEKDREEEKEGEFDDDLRAYMEEMEALESDFSDLDDLDMEELKEMQDAVAKVKEKAELTEDGQIYEQDAYEEHKEALMTDFSDLEELDLEEIKEMQAAIQDVRQEDIIEGAETQAAQPISAELEERIKEELARKREQEEEAVVSPEQFLAYLKDKRDKIWYHALWYLTFEVDDHTASKELLHDQLKEVTSKNALDPISYHQFVFGLGYILRLNVNNKQVVRYMSGSRFKININLPNLKEWLEITGEPISRRPIITKDEKKQMFTDFLKDDFLDI